MEPFLKDSLKDSCFALKMAYSEEKIGINCGLQSKYPYINTIEWISAKQKIILFHNANLEKESINDFSGCFFSYIPLLIILL